MRVVVGLGMGLGMALTAAWRAAHLGAATTTCGVPQSGGDGRDRSSSIYGTLSLLSYKSLMDIAPS